MPRQCVTEENTYSIITKFEHKRRRASIIDRGIVNTIQADITSPDSVKHIRTPVVDGGLMLEVDQDQ